MRKLMVQNLSSPKPDNSFAINSRRRKIITPGVTSSHLSIISLLFQTMAARMYAQGQGWSAGHLLDHKLAESHVLVSNVELTSWEQELHLLRGPDQHCPASVHGHVLSINGCDWEGRDKGMGCHLEPCDMKSLHESALAGNPQRKWAF